MTSRGLALHQRKSFLDPSRFQTSLKGSFERTTSFWLGELSIHEALPPTLGIGHSQQEFALRRSPLSLLLEACVDCIYGAEIGWHIQSETHQLLCCRLTPTDGDPSRP